MANKKYTEISSGTPVTTDVILVANPTTGVLKRVTVAQLLAATGGDVTAPTVVSATCPNGAANTVVVVFSEVVTATNVGWSFKKNGSAWTASSVAGSGTNTLTFTMATSAISTDTLLRSYDSTTGNTVDGSTNELVSFTDSSVTNSISGYLHRSLFTGANGTTIASYTPDNGTGWTETLGTGDIQSNAATTLTSSGGEWQAFTTLSQNTYELTTEITGTAAGKTCYLFFRKVDASNFMYLTIDHAPAGGQIKLFQYVAGVGSQVGGNITPTAGIDDASPHTYILTVGATTVDLEVDGTLEINAASIDAAASGNIIGIGSTGTAAPGDISYNSITVIP